MYRNGKYLVEIEPYHIAYLPYGTIKSYATISLTLLSTDVCLYSGEATIAIF